MASNAYSTRRKFLRRPKVCKASPNPGRCAPPPPPPPPPPPEWPPHDFNIFWTYTFFGTDYEFLVPLTRLDPHDDWKWYGSSGIIEPFAYANFNINEAARTFLLNLFSRLNLHTPSSRVDAYPIVWDVATDYDITEWDYNDPPFLISQAIFTF